MKIGLVSSKNRDNDIEFNVNEIKRYVRENRDVDLLCFGESFLQGFEDLCWTYEKDYKRAFSKDDEVIKELRKLARDYKTALSFGFIEKYEKNIYSSNMVIDSNGDIIDIFKRVSKGWKEAIATEEYKEGTGFHSFILNSKLFVTAICGDLWHDDLLEKIDEISADIMLWPLYIDYSIEQWNSEALYEYQERVKGIKCPVMMINSFVDLPDRANGGCYVFLNGSVDQLLPMGNIGVLKVEI